MNLNTLKAKLINLYGPQAKSKSIDFSVNLNSDKADVTFSKYKLLQIFGNLITNAIKFTPKNGSVTIDLSLNRQPDHTLHFVIKDTGVGMDRKKLDEILSGKAKSTAGTKDERGFGFGFQLVRHLVETMKGTLNIDSSEGEGTKVTIQVPLD